MTPSELRDPAEPSETDDSTGERRLQRGRSQKAFGMTLFAAGIFFAVVTVGLVVTMLLPFAVLTLVCAVIALIGARLVRSGEANAPSPDQR